jgi:hypothetical protein
MLDPSARKNAATNVVTAGQGDGRAMRGLEGSRDGPGLDATDREEKAGAHGSRLE